MQTKLLVERKHADGEKEQRFQVSWWSRRRPSPAPRMLPDGCNWPSPVMEGMMPLAEGAGVNPRPQVNAGTRTPPPSAGSGGIKGQK